MLSHGLDGRFGLRVMLGFLDRGPLRRYSCVSRYQPIDPVLDLPEILELRCSLSEKENGLRFMRC